MKKAKKLLLTLLCLLFCLMLLPISVLADSDGEQPAIITDSDNEMLVDPDPKIRETAETPSSVRRLLAVKPNTDPLACDFITNAENREYIERMIDWYLDTQPALKTTLADGFSVLMFFEGGSDNVDTASYSDLSYRDGAVVIILQNDEKGCPRIAGHCENCSTMPDYPTGYEYSNGHPGYGTATLIDGVYDLYTVNHRGTHAGFNVRMQNGLACVPCVYMRDDGTFALLNGTGINVHGRMRDAVSGDVTTPVSAGCLTVGDDATFTDYNAFLKTAVEKKFTLKPHTYNGTDIATFRFRDWDNAECYMTKAAAMVVDRYLAKDHMLGIYNNDREVVEYITAFSTASQRDTDNILASATDYPAYLTLTLSSNTDIKELPVSSATTLGNTDADLTATALYDVEGNYWYRVQFQDDTGYVPAESVSEVETKYDDLSDHNFNWPTEKAYGNSFSVTGILGSNYNRYTKVIGIILDEDGTPECTATHPGSGEEMLYTYSINASDGANTINVDEGIITTLYSTLDNKLAFSGLLAGQHQYLIKAVVKNYYVGPDGLTFEEKEKEILKKDFSVVPIAIVEGMDGKWKQGTADELTFVSNMSYSRFNRLEIDGQVIDPALYTRTTTNPLTVTLPADLLKTLTPGSHTLNMVGSYGGAETTFRLICAEHAAPELRNAKTPTLLRMGYSGDLYCTVCGDILQSGNVIPPWWFTYVAVNAMSADDAAPVEAPALADDATPAENSASADGVTVTSAATGDIGIATFCLSAALSGGALVMLKKKMQTR